MFKFLNIFKLIRRIHRGDGGMGYANTATHGRIFIDESKGKIDKLKELDSYSLDVIYINDKPKPQWIGFEIDFNPLDAGTTPKAVILFEYLPLRQIFKKINGVWFIVAKIPQDSTFSLIKEARLHRNGVIWGEHYRDNKLNEYYFSQWSELT